MIQKMGLCATAVLLSISLGLLPAAGQDKYAVVVGVETYDTSVFENLKFAAEDANELADSLQAIGFKTTVLTGDAESSRLRPTTPGKITAAIQSVANSCQPGDTLLVSLSGHGVQFSDESPLPSGVKETYFCPSDADLADKSSLLPISPLMQMINSVRADRKLLLIDACQEAVLSKNASSKGAKRIDLGSIHENRQSVPQGMATLFSCSSGQRSWEHAEIGHSVFTYYVVNYLQGGADSQFYSSGSLELNGLVNYVGKKTNDYVIGKNISPDGQFPVLRGSYANWSLGKVRGVDEKPRLLDLSADQRSARIQKARAELGRLERQYFADAELVSNARDNNGWSIEDDLRKVFIWCRVDGPRALRFDLSKIVEHEAQGRFMTELCAIDTAEHAGMYQQQVARMLAEFTRLKPNLNEWQQESINEIAAFYSERSTRQLLNEFDPGQALYTKSFPFIRRIIAKTSVDERASEFSAARYEDADRAIILSLQGRYDDATGVDTVMSHSPNAVIAPAILGRIDDAKKIALTQSNDGYQRAALLMIVNVLLDENRREDAVKQLASLQSPYDASVCTSSIPLPVYGFEYAVSIGGNFGMAAFTAGRLDSEAFYKRIAAAESMYLRSAPWNPPPREIRQREIQLRLAYLTGLVNDLR
ncbi:caspase family protein [Stieleria varia]|uniref:Caspase domain protein n=1 Tax=Stieleria varia TaxID=2528005 RepID=A0A5C6B2V0_9BACT|nr:caspase family protein [Stieleria varia]TWU05861.1 Caspase domain protein [Stieleria varia]